MPIPRWTPILYDIAQALESAQNPEARIDRVLALLKTFVPYDRCALLEATPLLSRPITIIPTPSASKELVSLKMRLEKLIAMLGEEAHDEEPATGARPIVQTLQAHLAVPILSLGKTIGLLYVERADPYDENHLSFLSIVAAQVGAYLTATRAVQRELDHELLQTFVAVLGHDLRNPLTAISGWVEVLRQEEGHMSVPLDRILFSTDRIIGMIDQLIDLTRVRLAEGIPIDRNEVDLAELSRQAIDEVRAGASSKASIHLEVHGDTSGHWDSVRLLQVISNLVSNAVQHTQGEHPIEVSVEGHSDIVVLRVHNESAIVPELLPVIFEPFVRVRTKAYSKGLGLGLFIAKHIVEAHGGDIAVESSPADGTTFTVTLSRVY